MIEAPSVWYGGVLFVGLNVLVAYTAHVIGRRLLPSADLPVRLTAWALTCVAEIVLLTQILSPFGLYRREVAMIVVAGAALVVHAAWGSHANVRGDVTAAWLSARAMATSRGVVVLALALAALLAVAGRAVTRRPIGWDSTTYHLPTAAAYVQTGRLVVLDGPLAIDHYAHFPKNGEMLTAWLLLPFHSDFVVGLMNVGLLVMCWLAVCGLARELDIPGEDAVLAATAVCTSPFLYSFATTQNVDSLVSATLVSSVLFLIRYLSGGAAVDAFFTSVAAGLALGTKYTALPIGAVVLAILGGAVVARHRRDGRVSRVLTWGLTGFCIVGAVGARQYLLNAAATRNPIYPLTLKLGAVDLLPASPYTDRLIEEFGEGGRGEDRFQFSGMFHYYPDWKTPTSAGPKYVLLILLALLAALRGKGRRAWAVRLIVVLAIGAIAAAEFPESGLPAISRRFWPASAARFLGASFALLAAVGLSIPSQWKGWRGNVLRAVIVGYIVWDLVAIGTHRFAERRGPAGWRDYASAVEVDGAPNRFVDGWRFVDQQARLTIALVTGSDLRGQNRFVYPLMGSRLQNTIVYVPINDTDPPGSRAFILRENPRFPEWIEGLDERRVQLVCAQSPWPIEDEWMRENPARFNLVFDSPDFRAYEYRAGP